MKPLATTSRARSPRGIRDGVRIRAIRPTDARALRAFYDGLSPESRRFRFFSINAGVSDAASTSFCSTDHDHREGFVAVAARSSDGDAIVGHLCLEPAASSSSTAEVAIAVADSYRGRGIGRRLLRTGIEWARHEGISQLTATMLPDNGAIYRLLLACGYPAAAGIVDGGIAEVTIDLMPATIAA